MSETVNTYSFKANDIIITSDVITNNRSIVNDIDILYEHIHKLEKSTDINKKLKKRDNWKRGLYRRR